MSGWDEAAGRVSQSFNYWFLIDGDQRAFLGLGLAFAKEVYERIWDEAGREPADPDGSEQIDIFEQRVHGLHQHDYEWMHCAGILREAVTNYEVYLEKAREEILRRTGRWQGVPENAPYWRELKDFYEQIGVDVEVDDIRRCVNCGTSSLIAEESCVLRNSGSTTRPRLGPWVRSTSSYRKSRRCSQWTFWARLCEESTEPPTGTLGEVPVLARLD